MVLFGSWCDLYLVGVIVVNVFYLCARFCCDVLSYFEELLDVATVRAGCVQVVFGCVCDELFEVGGGEYCGLFHRDYCTSMKSCASPVEFPTCFVVPFVMVFILPSFIGASRSVLPRLLYPGRILLYFQAPDANLYQTCRRTCVCLLLLYKHNRFGLCCVVTFCE